MTQMLWPGPRVTLTGYAGWTLSNIGWKPAVMRVAVSYSGGTIGILPSVPRRSPMQVWSPGYVGSTIVSVIARLWNRIASAWRVTSVLAGVAGLHVPAT